MLRGRELKDLPASNPPRPFMRFPLRRTDPSHAGSAWDGRGRFRASGPAVLRHHNFFDVVLEAEAAIFPVRLL